jgi:hypothetical protein
MDKYKRQIKLRLAWWITWWSLSAIMMVAQLVATIDVIRYPEYANKVQQVAAPFWLLVFTLIVFLYFPRTEELLKKDLKKNPENVYAKAMLLERELKKRKASEDVEKERGELERKVKSMEEELNK